MHTRLGHVRGDEPRFPRPRVPLVLQTQVRLWNREWEFLGGCPFPSWTRPCFWYHFLSTLPFSINQHQTSFHSFVSTKAQCFLQPIQKFSCQFLVPLHLWKWLWKLFFFASRVPHRSPKEKGRSWFPSEALFRKHNGASLRGFPSHFLRAGQVVRGFSSVSRSQQSPHSSIQSALTWKGCDKSHVNFEQDLIPFFSVQKQTSRRQREFWQHAGVELKSVCFGGVVSLAEERNVCFGPFCEVGWKRKLGTFLCRESNEACWYYRNAKPGECSIKCHFVCIPRQLCYECSLCDVRQKENISCTLRIVSWLMVCHRAGSEDFQASNRFRPNQANKSSNTNQNFGARCFKDCCSTRVKRGPQDQFPFEDRFNFLKAVGIQFPSESWNIAHCLQVLLTGSVLFPWRLRKSPRTVPKANQ